MLYIPEQNLIIIQPPRTASTSLRAAILARYPNSKSLYRHMERQGIPERYKTAKVACIARHPLKRLHSLWRYMRIQDPKNNQRNPAWSIRVRKDASRPFNDWLVHSTDVFTGLGRTGTKEYYQVKDHRPITRKSLWHWARPDLGNVDLLWIENPTCIEDKLDVSLPNLNSATDYPLLPLSNPAKTILHTYHGWDLAQFKQRYS